MFCLDLVFSGEPGRTEQVSSEAAIGRLGLQRGLRRFSRADGHNLRHRFAVPSDGLRPLGNAQAQQFAEVIFRFLHLPCGLRVPAFWSNVA